MSKESQTPEKRQRDEEEDTSPPAKKTPPASGIGRQEDTKQDTPATQAAREVTGMNITNSGILDFGEDNTTEDTLSVSSEFLAKFDNTRHFEARIAQLERELAGKDVSIDTMRLMHAEEHERLEKRNKRLENQNTRLESRIEFALEESRNMYDVVQEVSVQLNLKTAENLKMSQENSQLFQENEKMTEENSKLKLKTQEDSLKIRDLTREKQHFHDAYQGALHVVEEGRKNLHHSFGELEESKRGNSALMELMETLVSGQCDFKGEFSEGFIGGPDHELIKKVFESNPDLKKHIEEMREFDRKFGPSSTQQTTSQNSNSDDRMQHEVPQGRTSPDTSQPIVGSSQER